MSNMSVAQVEAAIETLETSYSYEPSRWMGTYQALRAVEEDFKQQLKPYQWIGGLLGWLSLAWYVVIVWMLSRPAGSPEFTESVWLNTLVYVTVMFLPAWLIVLGRWLTIRLAARRHPLLLFKSRIERAMRGFLALAGDSNSEEYA
jgi:hypothetical protein